MSAVPQWHRTYRHALGATGVLVWLLPHQHPSAEDRLRAATKYLGYWSSDIHHEDDSNGQSRLFSLTAGCVAERAVINPPTRTFLAPSFNVRRLPFGPCPWILALVLGNATSLQGNAKVPGSHVESPRLGCIVLLSAIPQVKRTPP